MHTSVYPEVLGNQVPIVGQHVRVYPLINMDQIVWQCTLQHGRDMQK